MTRVARTVIEDVAHHITQRGNNKQDVFFDDEDRHFYLETLKKESEAHGLDVHAYCLMTNHIHIVAVPKQSDSFAQALGRVHFKYAKYINMLHGRRGHLWQSRFYSYPIDDNNYPKVIRYVENNPVRAGVVSKAWKYELSSAAAHTGGKDSAGVLNLDNWPKIATEKSWMEYLTEHEDDMLIGIIRAKTNTGRPIGSDDFISKLETDVGRRLRPLPVGRPGKNMET